jgi:hypothetical protein
MLKAESLLEALRKCSVSHVVGLPDNSSAAFFSLLSRDKLMRLVTVTREGEAFGIASGLWIGGMTPVVAVQNTGLLESGDALRGTVLRMRIPLLCLVTYRGWARMPERPPNPTADQWDVDQFSRPELDSAALVTEPTLRAWGLPFDFLHSDADMPKIAKAVHKAEVEMRAVAILVTCDMT